MWQQPSDSGIGVRPWSSGTTTGGTDSTTTSSTTSSTYNNSLFSNTNTSNNNSLFGSSNTNTMANPLFGNSSNNSVPWNNNVAAFAGTNSWLPGYSSINTSSFGVMRGTEPWSSYSAPPPAYYNNNFGTAASSYTGVSTNPTQPQQQMLQTTAYPKTAFETSSGVPLPNTIQTPSDIQRLYESFNNPMVQRLLQIIQSLVQRDASILYQPKTTATLNTLLDNNQSLQGFRAIRDSTDVLRSIEEKGREIDQMLQYQMMDSGMRSSLEQSKNMMYGVGSKFYQQFNALSKIGSKLNSNEDRYKFMLSVYTAGGTPSLPFSNLVWELKQDIGGLEKGNTTVEYKAVSKKWLESIRPIDPDVAEFVALNISLETMTSLAGSEGFNFTNVFGSLPDFILQVQQLQNKYSFTIPTKNVIQHVMRTPHDVSIMHGVEGDYFYRKMAIACFLWNQQMTQPVVHDKLDIDRADLKVDDGGGSGKYTDKTKDGEVVTKIEFKNNEKIYESSHFQNKRRVVNVLLHIIEKYISITEKNPSVRFHEIKSALEEVGYLGSDVEQLYMEMTSKKSAYYIAKPCMKTNVDREALKSIAEKIGIPPVLIAEAKSNLDLCNLIVQTEKNQQYFTATGKETSKFFDNIIKIEGKKESLFKNVFSEWMVNTFIIPMTMKSTSWVKYLDNSNQFDELMEDAQFIKEVRQKTIDKLQNIQGLESIIYTKEKIEDTRKLITEISWMWSLCIEYLNK